MYSFANILDFILTNILDFILTNILDFNILRSATNYFSRVPETGEGRQDDEYESI
ncbi:hypothetical protein KSD_10600 [Ktedonobacter sp. SOSP1-85]|nr:hypothetical protein KSD_10600 [Ktedonobacter sp. SOSP1-85]